MNCTRVSRYVYGLKGLRGGIYRRRGIIFKVLAQQQKHEKEKDVESYKHLLLRTCNAFASPIIGAVDKENTSKIHTIAIRNSE